MKKNSTYMVALLSMALFLSGCASTEDGRLAQAQGTGIGAAGGALAGGLIGAMSGNAARGALIGALAGGVGGYAFGTHIANKKAQYAREEDWLDACIAAARKRNQDAIAYNQKLTSQVASLRRQVRDAQVAGDTRKLRNLKSQITSLKNDANKQIQISQKEVESQQSVIKQASSNQTTRISTIRKTTTSINGNIKQTTAQVQQLASLESQIQL